MFHTGGFLEIPEGNFPSRNGVIRTPLVYYLEGERKVIGEAEIVGDRVICHIADGPPGLDGAEFSLGRMLEEFTIKQERHMTTLPQTEEFRKNVLKSALQEAIYAQLDFIAKHPRIMDMSVIQLGSFQGHLADLVGSLERDSNYQKSIKEFDAKSEPPLSTLDVNPKAPADYKD